MNTRIILCLLTALLAAAPACPAAIGTQDGPETATNNQWKGKRVAFLGDSITDSIHVGTTKCYWEFLAEWLGIEPHVYAKNGNQWDGVLRQAERLKADGTQVDAIIANYEFDHSSADVALLRDLAGVAAMSHAPVIAGVAPSMFGLENWGGLANLRDLQSIFEGMQYTKWQAFRESEDSRYVGLVLPRFLLRSPYGSDSCRARTFNFREATMEDNDFCWGSAAFAFASRLTESFARYRWCANIIGPQGGGTVEDLPLYTYEAMGEVQNKIPTQVLISERREFELAEQGFIALTMRKGSDNAAFFSANSCQKPKTFGLSKEGREAELNYRLSTQLPYMFIMNRLAHYIKVIQREHIGTWKERQTLESELNRWLSQYVTEMDSPAPEVRSRRPLRYAQIEVHDVAGEPGFYSVTLKARPHFKYMGAAFTLSLVGKLDKA